MVKKRLQRPPVQKSGNIVRTVLIWAGLLLVVVSAFLVMNGYISDRVAYYMAVAAMVAYGFVLLDLDVDVDDDD